MKKLLTLFMLLGFVVAGKAQEQALKVGPLGFLLGNYNLRYEKKLAEKTSFQVGANYFSYKILGSGVTGLGFDASFRKYFKEALRGAYVSPAASLDFNSTNLGVTSIDTKYSKLGLGATLGYQWAKPEGFVVDLGLGYGYGLLLSKGEGITSDGYGGGGLLFTFAIGYAF